MENYPWDDEGDYLLGAIDLTQAEQIERADRTTLPIPTCFPDFPYPEPYPQQVSLMKEIYRAAEFAQCGLFESPTGTGKSLSLLTASIRWLLDKNALLKPRLDHLNQQLSQLTTTASDQPNWIAAFEQNRNARRSIEPEIEQLQGICSQLEKIRSIKQSAHTFDLSPISTKTTPPLPDILLSEKDVPEDEFLTSELQEPSSDEQKPSDGFVDQSPKLYQIIFCSRTHSQLSQLLDELKKCDTLSKQITAIQLLSRPMLCTNKNVYSQSTAEAINDACLELIKSSGGCPMRNKHSIHRLSEFLLSGHMATQVASAVKENRYNDLFDPSTARALSEQPGGSVARLFGCPYYASRESIPCAQLLLVPYATLLQRNTRTTSGIRLEDSVVIIDEAHNLLEATTACLSVRLEFKDLQCSLAVFRAYQQYYRTRFSAIVSLRLRQIIHFTQSLLALLIKPGAGLSGRVVGVPDLLSGARLDNLSLHQLLECLRRPHFLRKLVGFSKWYKKRTEQTEEPADSQRQALRGFQAVLTGMKRRRAATMDDDQTTVSLLTEQNGKSGTVCTALLTEMDGASSSLYKLQAFLEALVTSEDDARIVVTSAKADQLDESADHNAPSLYFTVLNPGHYLQDIVRESRCVLLAGGTMQPFDDLVEQVFVGKQAQDIVKFTCGHVIDPEKQLAVYPITESTDGSVSLDFTYQNRSSPQVMDACGEVVYEICRCTPGGVVVFLSSYEYQRTVCSHWESTGLLDRIGPCKRVFREPRNAVGLNQVMQAYTLACREKKHGALLICVIGGKLSEGINFSNDLARAVLIVGMPYPNSRCPLLQAKMRYLDATFSKQGHGTQSPGKRHYEALCMRAINQAIGRAVRHVNDYAAVFLLDRRFARPSVQTHLPTWVQKALRMCIGDSRQNIQLKEALDHMRTFFIRLSQQNSL